MRDPFKDPRPGDVIESKGGKRRRISYITIEDVVIYDSIGKKKVTVFNTCDLETWKRWVKGGSLVQQGDDQPGFTHERTIAFNLDLSSQVTDIANKIMGEINRHEDIKLDCTPDEETLLAIFEIGLAHYWSRSYDARQKVKGRVQELYHKNMIMQRSEYART